MEINTTEDCYPNIKQAVWIVVIFLLSKLVIKILLAIFSLDELIGESLRGLIDYVVSTGLAFVIVNAIRKRETDCGRFNFKIGNWQI